MSEDHIIGRKKKEESISAPDFFGSLGKGMVPKENLETLRNSSGLTPISSSVDVRNRIFSTGHVLEGFSTTEFTENKEVFKDSSGLTPLRPFVRKHKEELE